MSSVEGSNVDSARAAWRWPPTRWHGRGQVFRHALAVGDAASTQLVANQGVQGRGQFDGLIHLGEDGSLQPRVLEG